MDLPSSYIQESAYTIRQPQTGRTRNWQEITLGKGNILQDCDNVETPFRVKIVRGCKITDL